jgi:hypothetical protein
MAMMEDKFRIKCNICDARFLDIDQFCRHAPLCDKIAKQAKKDAEKLKRQIAKEKKAAATAIN